MVNIFKLGIFGHLGARELGFYQVLELLLFVCHDFFVDFCFFNFVKMLPVVGLARGRFLDQLLHGTGNIEHN